MSSPGIVTAAAARGPGPGSSCPGRVRWPRPVRYASRAASTRPVRPQQVPQQPAQVGQVARGARPLQQAQRPYVVLLGRLRVPGVLGDDAEEPVRAGRVHRAALGAEVAEHLVQERPPPRRDLPRRCSTSASSTADLAGVERGALGGEHAARLRATPPRRAPVAVLGVEVAAHPVAVGQLGTDLELPVELGRLGQRGVGLGDAALGEHRAGDRPVHPGDQRRVADLRRQREGELGGLRGAGVGAHVHVRADDAGVEQQQRVGVVQSRRGSARRGWTPAGSGVAEFAREVVGDGAAAEGGDARRAAGRPASSCSACLEAPPRGHQVAGLQRALAEPEQRRRPARRPSPCSSASASSAVYCSAASSAAPVASVRWASVSRSRSSVARWAGRPVASSSKSTPSRSAMCRSASRRGGPGRPPGWRCTRGCTRARPTAAGSGRVRPAAAALGAR